MASEYDADALESGSAFPAGQAELTVIAEGESKPPQTGEKAAEDFQTWLRALLERLPPAPVLPPEALDRANIYDD